ncbi:MAG: type I DNA topoisomerase [Chloroflexi bacterium]|nr:type I DNA topoisomerase [Chloroflexota bacterium]
MTKKKTKSLVVVESPAKARTIAAILGPEYEIKASVGHVRDLPKSTLGVDTEQNFEPKYVIPRQKAAAVKEIRQAAERASTIYLATDPDREGEAIAWHLIAAAELEGKRHVRVVFHEITPEAVREAFNHPRDIDMQLVDAQQARRVLDRLVGYRLSPFLWKQVRRGLSAGRVQSVAARLVVEREREIQAFTPREYWTIDAHLNNAKDSNVEQGFRARLVGYAEGKKRKLEIENQIETERLSALLKGAAYSVLAVQQKVQSRRPAPPFITSTLQQEASRRLGYSAKRTMVVAQQLYEGMPLGSRGQVGLITYMRTDSTQVAEVARREAREHIAAKFGKEFVPSSPRVYSRKVKGAQEAHEAIRPTSVLREPDAVRRYLNNDQNRLYTLIWQRFLASQMADAQFDQTSVEIKATPETDAQALLLRATNTQLRFAGYKQLYEEGKDNGEEEDEGTNPLPAMAADDSLRLLELFPDQHFTEPPPRFTEASLIKALEEKGIGRPSTYAPTVATIQDRGYVEKEKRQLRPTDLGTLVNDLLVEHFPDFVDEGFTVEMENELDGIASGERDWQPVVEQFYRPLERALAAAKDAAPQREVTDQKCEKCGKPMIVRWGRRGRFLACSGFPECRSSRPLEGEEEPPPEPTDEKCDECSAPMAIRSGRFGRFLACTRYPECKGRRSLLTKTGASCPRDGGDLVERRSRKGRTFYGCANYPKCDFVVWNKPLTTPCPQCKGLLTTERQQEEGKLKGRCSACDWRGEVEEKEPASTPA